MKRLAGPAAAPGPISSALTAGVLITGALLAPALLAACDASSAAVPPAAAKVSGICVTGIYDASQHEFYGMSGLRHGTRIASGDVIAEAYKLTLTDTSATTARVAGFSAAFHSKGRKLTSSADSLPVPAVLHPGQSRTLTEHPWGSSVAGHGPSAGPFRAGQDGAVDTAATCRLVRWRG